MEFGVLSLSGGEGAALVALFSVLERVHISVDLVFGSPSAAVSIGYRRC